MNEQHAAATATNEQAGSSAGAFPPHIPLAQNDHRRFVGDGLDFRRPIGSDSDFTMGETPNRIRHHTSGHRSPPTWQRSQARSEEHGAHFERPVSSHNPGPGLEASNRSYQHRSGRSPSVELVDLTTSTHRPQREATQQRVQQQEPQRPSSRQLLMHRTLWPALHPHSGLQMGMEATTRNAVWPPQPHTYTPDIDQIEFESFASYAEDGFSGPPFLPTISRPERRLPTPRPNNNTVQTNVIDLDASPPARHDQGTQTRRPVPVEENDDDLQIVSWESRPQELRRDDHNAFPSGPIPRARPGEYQALVNVLNSNAQHDANSWSRGRRHHQRTQNPRMPHRARRHLTAHQQWPPGRPSQVASESTYRLPPLNMTLPGHMDYMNAAFDIGLRDAEFMAEYDIEPPMDFLHNQPDQPGPHQPPELRPLPNVRDGFTRDPREQDELVCPNCDGELCNSPVPPHDTQSLDAQNRSKEVWVVKECGHVYCGLCADQANRNNKGAGKGKGKDNAVGEIGVWARKKLKTCVVDGCGENTTRKGTMFQVYL